MRRKGRWLGRRGEEEAGGGRGRRGGVGRGKGGREGGGVCVCL